MVSVERWSLESNDNYEHLDKLVSDVAVGVGNEHRESVCDGFGWKHVNNQQRKHDFQQQFYVATRLYVGKTNGNQWFELQLASFSWNQRYNPSFVEFSKLANINKFCRH